MRIAILDDESVFADQVFKYIGFGEDEVETYLDPTKLLFDIGAGKKFDVLFCDIMMEPINGIEVGNRIRKYDPDMFIIYLTSNIEFAPMGYEVKAFRYLLKPVKEDQLKKVLEDVKNELSVSKKIMLDTPDGNILVALDSIVYMEAMDKEVQIVCTDDSIVLRKTMTEIEAEFEHYGFYRIHRKYMVNLAHVSEFDKSKASLDTGETLDVSRRKSKDFFEAMVEYLELR